MKKLLLALCLSGAWAFGSQIVNPSSSGGTVNSGTAGQAAYYGSAGTTISGSSGVTLWTSSITLGSASFAVQVSTTVTMNSNKITGLSTGTLSTDAVAFSQIHFIQWVSTTTTGRTTTTSNAFADKGLSFSITPSSIASKVLIVVSTTIDIQGANKSVFATIARAGSNLGGTAGLSELFTPTSGPLTPCSMIYLDSPASTSSLTYTTQIRNSDNSTTAGIGDTSLTSSMMLFEMQ